MEIDKFKNSYKLFEYIRTPVQSTTVSLTSGCSRKVVSQSKRPTIIERLVFTKELKQLNHVTFLLILF